MFLRMITTLLNRGGWIGVDLFFVLSGFLISGLLFREHKQFGSISFKRFFIRRGFKIYPSFYILILTTILVKIAFGREIVKIRLLSELFFLQDYIKGLWAQNWSLAVEEQFYIMLPLLLILLARVRKSKDQVFSLIPIIFIFISVTCLGLRILTHITMPYTELTHHFPFHLRIDSLLFGVLISYFYHYQSFKLMKIVRRFKNLLLGLGVTLCVPAFIFAPSTAFINTIGFTFFYFASGLILLAIVDTTFKKNLFTDSLTSIGRHSYSIYLWHFLVLSWFSKRLFFPRYPWIIYEGTYLSGSILVGLIISKIIEFPMLSLRDRLYPSKSNLIL